MKVLVLGAGEGLMPRVMKESIATLLRRTKLGMIKICMRCLKFDFPPVRMAGLHLPENFHLENEIDFFRSLTLAVQLDDPES